MKITAWAEQHFKKSLSVKNSSHSQMLAEAITRRKKEGMLNSGKNGPAPTFEMRCCHQIFPYNQNHIHSAFTRLSWLSPAALFPFSPARPTISEAHHSKAANSNSSYTIMHD